MPSHRLKAVAVLALTTIAGCATVRPEIAIIEAGGTEIISIDRVKVPRSSAFEIRPGGHTIDVDVTWTEGGGFAGGAMLAPGGAIGAAVGAALRGGQHKERRSVCVKARGGRRYRIKTKIHDSDMDVFVIDASTGDLPKTPCGPDEDDD